MQDLSFYEGLRDICDERGRIILPELSYMKLWNLMLRRRIKLIDLADWSGVSLCTLTKMRRGEQVSLKVLFRICDCLECKLTDIFEPVSDEAAN